MRVGRATWRGWPTPTGTAWWRRATWCVRARPAPRSRGCGAPALALPNDAHHHALDHDVALVSAQRRRGGVGGVEPEPAPWLAIEAFHGGARALHRGTHGLAVVGVVPLVDDDEIAVLDVLVDHRLAPPLQHVAAAAAGNQLVGHGNRIGPAHGRDRRAGRDETVQRQLGGAGLTARRYDLDAAALVVSAPDVPFALEVREVLVHCGERAETEALGDLLEARGIALGSDLAGDEIEDFALTACKWHPSVPKRNRN